MICKARVKKLKVKYLTVSLGKRSDALIEIKHHSQGQNSDINVVKKIK
jgi:hypothetical protein